MSITLTTGKNIVINSVPFENDASGAVTDFTVDFIGNTLSFTLMTGTTSGSTFTAGSLGDIVKVTINLTTGGWKTSTGLSGIIGGGAIASFVAEIKADRNAAETFAAGGSNIMPGTQVPWS